MTDHGEIWSAPPGRARGGLRWPIRNLSKGTNPVESTEMRMVRPEWHWRVLFVSRRAPECLHRLALGCGYRVGELTEALECRERYLHEVFTRDIGLPPKLWMRRERMVVARRMLAGGRTPEVVAERLGFSWPGSFRREFIAIYQVTPGRYQEVRRESTSCRAVRRAAVQDVMVGIGARGPSACASRVFVPATEKGSLRAIRETSPRLPSCGTW